MTQATLPLSPEVFKILSALIEERVGIHYEPADADLIVYKLSDRAIEAGFDSLLDYYYYLRYDAGSHAEFEALIDALVVGETYFFREFEQLRIALEDFVLPVVQRGSRARIWSAACSTGEEPLTVAMLLSELGVLQQCHLIASDLSQRALSRARSGRFGIRALRSVPARELAERYLSSSEGRVTIRSELLDAVDWRRINLIDMDALAQMPRCDLILCRNALIYFSDATTERVVEALTAQLHADGALLVGVSESLLRFTSRLSCEERRGVFVYRRRAGA